MACEFELDVDVGTHSGDYVVRVVQSVTGMSPTAGFSLDVGAMLRVRDKMATAVLSSTRDRQKSDVSAKRLVRDTGARLFDCLFPGPILEAYHDSMLLARERGEHLLLRLRLRPPELAAIPWEAMLDPTTDEFLCLTGPFVREVEAPITPDAIAVNPPLRVLGLVAALGGIDAESERANLAGSLSRLVDNGQVNLDWPEQGCWENLQQQLLSDPCHVLHFIGHGNYDAKSDRGSIILENSTGGGSEAIDADNLAYLLRQPARMPSLVVLNACMTGRTSARDQFSATAAKLVRRGVAAVAAMQFNISDQSAIEFSFGFYAALAGGSTIDAAVQTGRIAIATGTHTFEWLTPVLYARGNTRLFNLDSASSAPIPGRESTTAGPENTSPTTTKLSGSQGSSGPRSSVDRVSRLIVFVPGLGEEPDTIDQLYQRLQSDPAFGPPESTQLFRYPSGIDLLTRDTLAQLCGQLAYRIASVVQTLGGVDSVILVGHSIGGLMVRASYLQALPGPDRVGLDWAKRVTRIVLLAAPNSGFNLNRAKWWQKPLARMLAPMPLGLACTDALVGSPFIDDLRARWTREMTALGNAAPAVVQLLGDDDQLVNYGDSLDIHGIPNGVQRALPNATHKDIVRIDDVPEDIPGQRYDVLRWAILGEVNPAPQITEGVGR